VSLQRFSRPASRSILIAGVAVLLLGAVSRQGWVARARHRAVIEQVTTDLRRAQLNLKQGLDSTTLQINTLTHLIAWLDKSDDVGSADAVSGLSNLRGHKWTPGSLTTVLGLAATGELDQLPDAVTRGRILALDRSLAEAQRSAEPGFEQFRELMEQTLTTGMWRYVFYGESGTYPIDYKAALRDLIQHGLQSRLRSLLRGLMDERAELTALYKETTDLLMGIAPLEGESGKP
jgi:hypothetical protein